MVHNVGLPPVPKKKPEDEYKHEYADKFAYGSDDIPDVEHWAIVAQGRHSEAGYNKGDPSEIGFHLDYEVYLTKEKWERCIQYKLFGPSHGYREKFKALHVLPAKLSLSVTVTTSE